MTLGLDSTTSITEFPPDDGKVMYESDVIDDKTKTPVSGIYTIVNEVNGTTYIGSSADIESRWKHHRGMLRRNKHHNIHLQRSWNKYGFRHFKFVVEEAIRVENLLEVEQQYLDVCKLFPTFYYNICFVAGAPMRGRVPWNKGKLGVQVAWNKGVSFSEEVRQKMSNSAKKKIGNKNPMFGRKHSSETRQRLILACKKRPPVSAETREKMKQSSLLRWRNK